MVPDLEKIIAADRKARAAVTQAQETAQTVGAQAQQQIQAIRADLQAELAGLKKTAQDEILQAADARAADLTGATQKYIQSLQEKQQIHRDEAAAFMVSQVLAG